MCAKLSLNAWKNDPLRLMEPSLEIGELTGIGTTKTQGNGFEGVNFTKRRVAYGESDPLYHTPQLIRWRNKRAELHFTFTSFENGRPCVSRCDLLSQRSVISRTSSPVRCTLHQLFMKIQLRDYSISVLSNCSITQLSNY